MTPIQPSRRGLLSGLLGLLFGWLIAKKAVAGPKGNMAVPISNPPGPIIDNAAGRFVSCGPLGNVTTFVYDGGGNFLYQSDLGGSTTTVTYDGGPR